MSIFIDRTEELEFLEAEYARDSSSLVVIYGRRRVGKTELVRLSQNYSRLYIWVKISKCLLSFKIFIK